MMTITGLSENEIDHRFNCWHYLSIFVILFRFMSNKISSLANTKIRALLALQSKSSERRSLHRFVVEGFREINKALESAFSIQEIYYCRELAEMENVEAIISGKPWIKAYEIDLKLFGKLVYRDHSDGLIVVVDEKKLNLSNVTISHSPLFLVIESIEKPGNLGAILRTADGANVDVVFVCDPRADIYNPNVIRNSLGGIFTRQVVECSSEEAYHWLKKNNIPMLAAALTDSAKPYFYTDFRKAAAIIMGSEANGLSEFWLKNADQHIIIPMLGKIDSLNVSTSAAIIIFEAVRQRMS